MPKPDAAHLQTDKELAKLEKRIAKIYKEAADDLQSTIDDYFAKFAKRDEKQKARLDAGEITEQEYKQWRLAQMGRGERFKALQSRVAERYTEANETAVRYVNDATPGIYSLNRNYSAYTIEKVAGNVGFDLWDEQTVRRLIVDNPEVMPYYPPEKALNRGIDLAYGKKQISASVTSSILQGKSIPGIAKDLQTRMSDMNKSSAVRTARTAVTGAQNAGRMDSYVAAEKMGVKVRKEWLATIDGRTRHSHAMLDGKVVDKDKKFENGCMFPGDPNGPPWEVYNCRCTLIASVDGVDTYNAQRRVRNPETGKNELVSDMTYQEWAGWKENAQVQKAMAQQAETYSTFADGEQASKFFGERPPRSLRRENREEYDRLREEYRQSSFGSWYEGLSGEETTSIAEYSGDSYSGINGLLRGHMTEKMVKAWDDVSSMGIREMIDHIDDSISRFELKKGIKVYRTCEKDVFESLSTQVGSKFVDDGFVSTTVLKKKVASGNVFMEIDVPPGTGRGAWINPLSGSADKEWEFLLQRGSVFEITDVSDVGDDIVVKMKWTGIEKKDIKFASREDVIDWQKKNGLYDETEEYRI